MRTECLCISVIRITSGPRVKVVDTCALNSPVVYTTDRSKPMVPVFFFVVNFLRQAIYTKCCLAFCLCVFSPFSIAITSPCEERAGRYVCFLFVCFARDDLLSLSSSSWCQGLAATCDCGTPWPKYSIVILPITFFVL